MSRKILSLEESSKLKSVRRQKRITKMKVSGSSVKQLKKLISEKAKKH